MRFKQFLEARKGTGFQYSSKTSKSIKSNMVVNSMRIETEALTKNKQIYDKVRNLLGPYDHTNEWGHIFTDFAEYFEWLDISPHDKIQREIYKLVQFFDKHKFKYTFFVKKKELDESRKGTVPRYTPSQRYKVSRPRGIQMELKGAQLLPVEIRKKLTHVGHDEVAGLHTGDWVRVNRYVIPPSMTDDEILQMITILDKNKIDYEYLKKRR